MGDGGGEGEREEGRGKMLKSEGNKIRWKGREEVKREGAERQEGGEGKVSGIWRTSWQERVSECP